VAEILGESAMKRIGNLWNEIISYNNLFAAAKAAAAGKRHRADVARFGLDLENEIVRLRNELNGDAYQPGPYRCFEVREPKRRLISAAPFRDRVVHHALTRVMEPIFERRFTSNSYACRKGRGTHRALEAARKGCATYRCVLKCDVRKYFPSIDHAILEDLLGGVLKCPRSLELAGKIIDGSNAQEPVAFYFPGDDLFTPHERRKGLPLGNQTSQFFANVYLNPLDHFVTRCLRPGLYVRYVDDFLLFGNSRQELAGMRISVEKFLEGFRLKIHARKSRVYRTGDGVTFLGWRIFPDRMRLVRQNVVRFRRRLRWMQDQYAAGLIDWDEMDPRVRAWIAHAAHGDTWRLRTQIFGQCAFRRGSAAGTARRVLEQQFEERPRIQPQQEQS
jgi:retron-type reverse transcriptase